VRTSIGCGRRKRSPRPGTSRRSTRRNRSGTGPSSRQCQVEDPRSPATAHADPRTGRRHRSADPLSVGSHRPMMARCPPDHRPLRCPTHRPSRVARPRSTVSSRRSPDTAVSPRRRKSRLKSGAARRIPADRTIRRADRFPAVRGWRSIAQARNPQPSSWRSHARAEIAGERRSSSYLVGGSDSSTPVLRRRDHGFEVVPAGFVPAGALKDFVAKFAAARYVIDPGTNQERTVEGRSGRARATRLSCLRRTSPPRPSS
jgi:hypothetical protein